jgi:DNA-binding SARP family transcriptional activator
MYGYKVRMIIDATRPTAPVGDASRYELRTLGTMELIERRDDGSASLVLPRGKPLALLIYCCSARRREYSREALASLLWSDAAPERARHNVRQALWRIRRQLGDVLETREESVVGIGPGLTIDREEFLDAVYRNDADAALQLYRGPFLDGVTVPGGAEFDDWASAERFRLEDALVRVTEAYLRSESLQLKPRERRVVLEQLVQKAPDHLEARRIAVETLLELGDRTAAQREADALEHMALVQEVDLSPSATASIARARESTVIDHVIDVPVVTFDLVGRDEVFGRVVANWNAARQGRVRAVLLTGVAGIGKSRLLKAIHARCTGRRTRALTVRCNAGEREVPFGFAAMLTRALAHQPGAAGINADSAWWHSTRDFRAVSR